LAARKRMMCRFAGGRDERLRRGDREGLGETEKLDDASGRRGRVLDGGQSRDPMAPPASPVAMGVAVAATAVQVVLRGWVKTQA
jgi:hypothetical protein